MLIWTLLVIGFVSDPGITNFSSVGLPDVGSDGHKEIWNTRMREVS